jgi:hypothetical protein
VSVGIDFACALDDAGVRCWGKDSLIKKIPVGIKNPRVLATELFGFSACVLDDEDAKCWGLCYNKGTCPDRPKVPSNLKNPKAISMGTVHVCVLDDEGVKCGGRNRFGAIDIPAGLKNPRALAAGSNHTCVLDDEGMKCWGWNGLGQTDVP